MKGHPTSYKDPTYDTLDERVTAQLDLPPGLLNSIRTRGERSNSDQVSEAGARTVYQITPTTRRLITQKYGIDPYLSPELAAEGAGLLLKESLDRNKGNVRAAVAEYHGGTDLKNHGPRTKAYVARVAGSQSSGASTFDRVMGQRQEAAKGPSLTAIYQAYKSGKMTPQEAAQYEADVNGGAMMMPRGGSLKSVPSAPVLPQGVIDAANAENSPMSVDELKQLHDDVSNGVVALPKGQKLNPFRVRSTTEEAGRQLALGGRRVAEGVGAGMGMLTDLITRPVNAFYDMIGMPGRGRSGAEVGSQLADSLGAPVPVTDAEKLVGAAVEAGASALPLMAAGQPLAAGGRGATQAIGAALTELPASQVVGSAGAGAGGEMARQEGVGPVGQFAASLAAAFPTAAGAMVAERAAVRALSPNVTKVIETTPREVVIDQAGELTEEGAEIAIRNGIEPAELKAAYDAPPPNVQRGVANDGAEPQARARVVGDNTPPTPETPAPPVSHGSPKAAPEAPVEPTVSGTAATDIPPSTPAAARVAEAQSEGIPLTRGQAEQDFAIQDAEQTLRAQASGEGEKARQFYQQQQDDIQVATQRFRETFGDTSATATDRGAKVQEAIRELRDLGKQGVSALYKTAQELGGDGLDLDTAPIVDAARRALVEADVPDAVKNVIRQEMARYGLVGKVKGTDEFGLTTVQLKDGGKVQFYGEPQQLTVANAEELRKAISAQYMSDGPRKLSQPIKAAIDDAVEQAVEKAASSGATGNVGEAYQAARQAAQQQKQTFNSKDIVQQLADFKKGTATDALKAENVIKTIFSTGPEALTNLKKVKALLLSKPTEKSKAAWDAIKATGVGDIIGQAYTVNANAGGGSIGAISGAKLNTAIQKFGPEKLKVLLDGQELDRLMKLSRIIGNATIPISGTTNPSGSAFKLMRFLGPMASRLVPFGGQIADTVGGIVSKAREVAQAQKTLRGVTDYTPVQAEAAQAADRSANEFLQSFIEAAGSHRLLTPALAATQVQDDPQSR